MIINWIKDKLFPLIQKEDWFAMIFKRVDSLERKSKYADERIKDLETKSFVEQFPKMKNYEGTD